LCGKSEKTIKGHMIYFECLSRVFEVDINGMFPPVFIQQSANFGNAFAQALLAKYGLIGLERFKMAEQSALQGEREGFEVLALCYFHGGDGAYPSNLELSVKYFYLAAKLGSVSAMFNLGTLLNRLGPLRLYYWQGKAFALGYEPDRDEKDDCIAFYKNQLTVYRKMVDMWTLVAIRFGVCKDIRRVISKMIWKERMFTVAPSSKGVLESLLGYFGF